MFDLIWFSAISALFLRGERRLLPFNFFDSRVRSTTLWSFLTGSGQEIIRVEIEADKKKARIRDRTCRERSAKACEGKYTRRRENSSIHSVLHFIVHPILQFDSFLFFNSIRSFYFFVFFYASGRTTDALLSTKRRVATVCHSFPFDGAYHNPWA